MLDTSNPTPALFNQLSSRLRKHLKVAKPKVRLNKWSPITVSVSTALKAQAQEYQPDLSLTAIIQAATIKFLTAKRPYQCPVKFTPTTKFAPRNAELGGRLPIAIHEELQAYADKHGLTLGAVVRRAVYEYTKSETPDPVAAIDAWADREKLMKGI